MHWINRLEQQIYKKENLSFFSLLLVVLGLFTANSFRALPGIGLALLFLTSITGFSYSLFKESLKKRQNLPFVIFSGVFFLHLIYVVNVDLENWNYFWERISIKLPFLILSISFILLPKISEKRYLFIYYFYFIILFITIIMALANYIQHFEAINEAYHRSKTLPVIVNHVRYSLMVCLGIFIGIWLSIKKFHLFHRIERAIIITITVIMFLFLHLMSVRSGLFAFYLILIISSFYVGIKEQKIKQSIIVVIVCIFMPLLCYFTIPTFKNKVENSLSDLSQLNDQYMANYHSLTGRIFSYKVGWSLFKENPVFGVGIGNLKQQTSLEYIKDYGLINESKRLLPHNQYLRYLTAFGIIGMSVFLICFYAPLFLNKSYHNYMLFLQYLIVSISFLFEGTLETQLGNNLSILFILLPLYYIRDQTPHNAKKS